MEYINTYLDKMRVLLEKGGSEGLFRELTDEKSIESMFVSDAKNVYKRFKAGEISEEDARKNLQLLKLYIISQLPKHRMKVLDFFDEKELPELDEEMIRRVVEFIEEVEVQI
jgi:HEPN domain-containing protein